MTSWLPDLSNHKGPRYRAIAEALAEDVRAGRLAAGTRLPTHRDLAWKLRVTIGTVSRAYAEAERRGLIAGEVGRGTYVRQPGRSAAMMPGGALDETRDPGFIDLTINRPAAAGEEEIMAAALQRLAADPDLGGLLDYQAPAGRSEERAAAAAFLERFGLTTSPGQVVITAGGQHAMACVIRALTRPGDIVAVEELTYPGLRALAGLLHLRLAPVAIDGEGLIPQAFELGLPRSAGARPLHDAHLAQSDHRDNAGGAPRGRGRDCTAARRGADRGRCLRLSIGCAAYATLAICAGARLLPDLRLEEPDAGAASRLCARA